jgi:hypothetical protein
MLLGLKIEFLNKIEQKKYIFRLKILFISEMLNLA